MIGIPSSLRPRPRPLRAFATLALCVAASACRSPEEFQAEADRQVYAILEERRAALDFGKFNLDIQPPAETLRDRIDAGAVRKVGPLSLVEALNVAAENSRDYQEQLESLYLSALDLTLEQYAFQIQQGLFGLATINGQGSADQAGVGADYNLSKLFGNGAQIISDIGFNLVKDLSSGDPWKVTTDLAFAFTQPFLRGSGALIVEEPLTQAERNTIYAVRDFERFRRTFAYDCSSRYFNVLLQRSLVENQRLQAVALTVLRERTEAMAQGGRLPDIQADQAKQDELNAQNQLILVEQRYQNQVDDFKFFLGLPIEIELELDPAEIERLSPEKLEFGPQDETRMVEYALAERLDHQNIVDARDDAERGVYVAADALGPGLALAAAANLSSNDGQPLEFSLRKNVWNATLELDLPIDRLPERNAYRASLISLQQAQREVERQSDQITADLRSTWREALAALETWQFQEFGVRLAERRVEGTALSLQAGRATTRDQLDAQDSLLEARNALATARVTYYLAQLALYRELELLRVDEQGLHVDYTGLETLKENAP